MESTEIFHREIEGAEGGANSQAAYTLGLSAAVTSYVASLGEILYLHLGYLSESVAFLSA